MSQISTELLPVLNQLSQMTKEELEDLGFSLEEILTLEILTDPVKWAKEYLNWTARDYQELILEQGAKRRRLVLRLGRRLGKCLPGWVKIFDPTTGKRVPIEEIYRSQQANVLTMNSNYKLQPTYTTQVWDNGVKEVFRVTLKSGRQIDATGNHPLYRIDGWVEIDDLKPGDKVATPRILHYQPNQTMPEHEIKLMAYLLGDGNVTTTTLRFANTIPAVVEEFKECVDAFGDCAVVQYHSHAEYEYNIVKKPEYQNRNHKSSIIEWLKQHGIFGKNALEKEIPSIVFELPKEQIALFLSRLYATDGWATATNHEKPRIEIGYASSSYSLIEGVQHLLLRFGIQSQLKKKKVRYNGEERFTYQLGIYRKQDVLSFIEQIGIFGKEAAIEKVKEVASLMKGQEDRLPVEIMEEAERLRMEKRLVPKEMLPPNASINDRYRRQYAPQRSVIKHYGEVLESERLQQLGESDLYWDEVVSIESLGMYQTYDLTIPETKNFVANDVIVHNTECMCVLILWHAFTQINRDPEKPMTDPYDILILTPYEKQAIHIYDRLIELIEASPELKGSIRRKVFLRLELHNNACIQIMTLGADSGKGAANIRGQRADLLVYDE